MRQNTRTTRPRARTPLATSATPDAVTGEGAPAYSRDLRTALFTLAVTNMGGEDTFYESGAARSSRYTVLIHAIAPHDPAFVSNLLPWLRQHANLRTAPLQGAIEFGRALDEMACAGRAGEPLCSASPARWFADERWYCDRHRPASAVQYHPRKVLASTLQRADEPGEALAYWTSTYGRKLPEWVKRGISDGTIRLWTEYAAAKYDSPERAWRMADVLELCHPGDRRGSRQRLREFQRALFPWLIERRHNRPSARTPSNALPMLTARNALFATPVADRPRVVRNPELLAAAGITHEALAGFLQGPMDSAAWEAVLPQMGYAALLKSLRRLEEAGLDRHVRDEVCRRLTDPDEVARSRQFPYRFLSAYLALQGDTFRAALGDGLDLATRNIRALPGNTLVVIDASGSMGSTITEKSAVQRWQLGALFAYAVAATAPRSVDVVAFGTISAHAAPLQPGGSVLRSVERFRDDFMVGYRLGHGTNTASAVAQHYAGHDRVVVFTDDQAHDGDPGGQVPRTTPVYLFDLAGNAVGSFATGPNRHLVAGFTDAAFSMIRSVERARDARWPWEENDTLPTAR